MPSNATIKQLRKLHQKKYRQEAQQFLVEGEKVVCELLESNWQIDKVYASDSFIEKHQNLINKANCTITRTTRDKLNKIGSLTNNNQAIALVKMQLPPSPMGAHRDTQSSQTTKLTLALDQINDPGNLGTLVRLADWYGLEEIICSPNSVDLYNPKTLQATKGSFLRVKVTYQNLKDLFTQSSSGPVYGATLEGDSIHQLNSLQAGGILLLGNESHGISPELKQYLTQEITIPKFGEAESLNVGIACGIILDNFARLTN